MKHAEILVLAVAMLLSACTHNTDYIVINGTAQGGAYQVKLRAKDASRSPEELKEGIDSILLCIDNSVSGYNPLSLLSRFNAGESVAPDSIFTDLYSISRKFWKETNGAVDVAAGPLFDIWGFGFTTDSLPSPQLVEETRAHCGMALLPDELEDVVPGTAKLNFNCIAQGYSCDLIAAWLEACGVHDMLINVGGEIWCDGVNPSGEPWTVGIDRPVDGNFDQGKDLEGLYKAENVPCGIVTSGNYRKFYVKDGHKYSHTIDPRTGMPVEHTILCATVISPDAATADALATYCMVVGLDEASAFILADDSLEGCLVYDEDGTMKAWTSPGFKLLDSKVD